MDKDYILEKLDGRYTVNEETDCWVWNGTTEKNGNYYPQISIDYVNYYVYRLMAYVHSNINNINNLGLVKHSCKNKRCINPDHLKFDKGGIKIPTEMDGVIVKYMEDSKTTNKDKAIVDLLSIGIYYYYYIKEEE